MKPYQHIANLSHISVLQNGERNEGVSDFTELKVYVQHKRFQKHDYVLLRNQGTGGDRADQYVRSY